MATTRNQTARFLQSLRRTLPEATILRAVNGFNYSETIEALLDARVPFRNLSRGGKKWGVLATFLTHFRSLEYQVARRIPFQLTLEEDLWLRREPFLNLTRAACDLYDLNPEADVLQLAHYGEARMTSLRGAAHLVELIRQFGIQRSWDQQLFHGAVMGNCHRVMHHTEHMRWKPPSARPFILGRPTNGALGHIYRSRHMTWSELAMLRLLSDPAARELPAFGNPPHTDYRTTIDRWS